MKYLRKFASGLRKLRAGLARVLGKFFGMFDARDLFLFAGLGLLAFGLHMVWPPAAFIVPGSVLVYVALAMAAA